MPMVYVTIAGCCALKACPEFVTDFGKMA